MRASSDVININPYQFTFYLSMSSIVSLGTRDERAGNRTLSRSEINMENPNKLVVCLHIWS